MTYIEFVKQQIEIYEIGVPIHSARIAQQLAREYDLTDQKALAAVAVATKRLMERQLIPDLRAFQKGIYYRTKVTPFGEVKINRERLIAEKYLNPDNGYETGFRLLNLLGLTTQIAKGRVLATNIANGYTKTDKELGVVIRPPKVRITADNKDYLQVLDALSMLNKAPIDIENPYDVIAEYVKKKNLKYDKLIAWADRYYDRETVIGVAHTVTAGEPI